LGAFLNFKLKESPNKVSIGTAEKLTLENMGVVFGILSLGGTEPEIQLGVIYPPPNYSIHYRNTTAKPELRLMLC